MACRLHGLAAMMRAAIKDLLATVAVLAAMACGGPQVVNQAPVSSQSASGLQAATAVAPRVSINATMVALVDHASHHLWNAERDGMAPKTAEDWRTIEEHATQLAAIAPVLMIGGTGPTDAVWVKAPTWRSHVQSLSDAAVEALNAARARNLTGLVAANGRLVESCEACHKEFKPAAPTEGIVHAHAH